MSSYSLAGYASMLNDPSRVPAYLEALRRAVKPGSVVLDLGAGFGYFSLVACRLGAARVYAIEPAESVSLVPELARRNGFGERVIAIRDLSTKVTLPERVDVVVADIRGVLPTLGGSLHTLIDARDRLMAPGGTLLPRRDRLLVVPVEDRATWERCTRPWENPLFSCAENTGFDFTPVAERLVHGAASCELKPRTMLAPAKVWAEIDYHTNTSRDLEGQAEFSLAQLATVHGWGVWFEAEIMEGLRYSTGPDNLPTVYGTAFFCLPEPLRVQPNDAVRWHMSINDVDGHYYLRWRTKHVRDGRVLASFDQGDFYAQSLDLERMKQRLPTYVPELKPDGQLARMVIEGAHQGRTIGQIATSVLEAFPGRFENIKQAIDHAAQLLQRING